MVSVPSTMLPLGTEVPDFVLTNAVDDKPVTPRDYAGRNGLLVMFICNHCPFVKHVMDEIGRIAAEAPAADQRPSIGCNIKWRAGNQPEYFTAPIKPKS